MKDKILAFGFQRNYDSSVYIDPSMFTIKAINYFYYSDDEKFSNQEVQLSYHLCSPEDFPNNPEIYKDLVLKNLYCLDNNTLNVKGYWDKGHKNYATFQVHLCDKSTSKITCAPYEKDEKNPRQ
jgi:hypothetical protein